VLLTVEKLAAWLDMSRSATYELILTGAIRSVKVGRARRVPVASVRDFVTGRYGFSVCDLVRGTWRPYPSQPPRGEWFELAPQAGGFSVSFNSVYETGRPQ